MNLSHVMGRASIWAKALGVVLLMVWAAFAIAGIWSLINGYENYREFLPKYANGVLVTISLVAVSFFLGALLSFPITLARLSNSYVLRGASFSYVHFFRATPLIAQTFLVYYGVGEFREPLSKVGLWWLFRDPFYCAVFVFSLNSAAYQVEILRGAILNVPKGQAEAGRSLGLGQGIIFFRILLPQALVIALRPYGNEIILLLKGSAIASIITVFDVMGETRRAFSRTFDYNTYLLAAVVYLMLVEAIRRLWDKLEKWLTRYLSHH